jgi:hypothetical protein
MDQEEINALCLGIYEETARFAPIASLKTRGLGFEILMGPPFKNTDCLFIGYQPGDWSRSVEEARSDGYENNWVTDYCHYASADWRLAGYLRSIFGEAFLQSAVGLNSIFVRSRNRKSYEIAVSFDERSAIKQFCLHKLERIISAIKPKRIVVIGFKTMDLFDTNASVFLRGEPHPLIKYGRVFGREAFAVRHLTGAHFFADERQQLANS